jgi:TPR repeat protein
LYACEGVSKELNGAGHYWKLAADQGFAVAQYRYAICFINGDSLQQDVEGGLRYFKDSAENGNPNGQLAIGCMAENGIGRFSANSVTIAESTELNSRNSRMRGYFNV